MTLLAGSRVCPNESLHRLVWALIWYSTASTSRYILFWQAAMEHPAMPSDRFPSILRTPLHRSLLMRAPFAQLVYVEHAVEVYGADSVKPTILRGLGLPGRAHLIYIIRSHISSRSYPPIWCTEGPMGGFQPEGTRVCSWTYRGEQIYFFLIINLARKVSTFASWSMNVANAQHVRTVSDY